MSKKSFIKILFAIFFLMIVIYFMRSEVKAQSKAENFKSFTVTGNTANDIASCAEAQAWRTQYDMGYTEQWCADFVCDCAIKVGAQSSIPFNPNAGQLFYAIKDAGGQEVNSPQRGDLVFYYCTYCKLHRHVGIMTSSNASTEGNYNDIVTPNVTTYTATCGHSTSDYIARIYVRPAYSRIITNTRRRKQFLC